eukprot:gene31558-35627_t
MQQRLRLLGFDTQSMLRRAGLPADLFASGKARITTRQMFAVWDALAAMNPDPALGLRIGAEGATEHYDIASIAALQTGAAPTAYSVAKAGVLHLTTMAAADLSRYNIRVNAVCPGFITTNIFTAALGIEGEKREMANGMIRGIAAQAQPLQRPGRAEDIAAAVAYLASDDASFVTGTHITVDGGITIGPRHSWDAEAPSMFSMLE